MDKLNFYKIKGVLLFVLGTTVLQAADNPRQNLHTVDLANPREATAAIHPMIALLRLANQTEHAVYQVRNNTPTEQRTEEINANIAQAEITVTQLLTQVWDFLQADTDEARNQATRNELLGLLIVARTTIHEANGPTNIRAHIIAFLINNGTNIHHQNNNGNAIYHQAAIAGNLPLLRWLEEGRRPIHELNGMDQNIYHLAAINGHLHILHWFHQNGLFPIENQNQAGDNIYHLAAMHGHLHILEWGFQINANNPGFLLQLPNHQGQTIYALAQQNGRTYITAWLDQNHPSAPVQRIQPVLFTGNLNLLHPNTQVQRPRAIRPMPSLGSH